MTTLAEYKVIVQGGLIGIFAVSDDTMEPEEVVWADTGNRELPDNVNTAEFAVLRITQAPRQGQDCNRSSLELVTRMATKWHETRAALLYSFLTRYTGQRAVVDMRNEDVDQRKLYTTYTYRWDVVLENDYRFLTSDFNWAEFVYFGSDDADRSDINVLD